MKQAITWTNVDEVLWFHMLSLGHNELIDKTGWPCSQRSNARNQHNILNLVHHYFSLPSGCSNRACQHYNDVIMNTVASQITSLTIVSSIVYLSADQRKHQSSALLAFVRVIHRRPVNSPHKGPVTRQMFPLIWWRHHEAGSHPWTPMSFHLIKALQRTWSRVAGFTTLSIFVMVLTDWKYSQEITFGHVSKISTFVPRMRLNIKMQSYQ